MIVNKWIQLALSVVIGLCGIAAGFDWTSVVSAATAGKIAFVVAAIKGLTNILAPSPSQTTVDSTGGSVITHT